MSDEALLRMIRDVLAHREGRWTLNRVLQVARAFGMGGRTDRLKDRILDVCVDGSTIGSTLGTTPGLTLAASENSRKPNDDKAFLDTGPPDGSTSGSTVGSTLGVEVNTLAPSLSPHTPLSLPFTDTSGIGSLTHKGLDDLKSARARGKTEWFTALEDEVRALAKCELRSLDATQRFALARYHAAVFGRCTKNENRNKYRATSIAAGLASLGSHREFGTISVARYINTAKRVHERRGGSPWFKVWDIIGELERA